MKKITASCQNAGTLVIPNEYSQDKNGNADSGNLADYTINSPEKLHEIASNYAWVWRGGNKLLPGSAYTLKMAQNDFSKYAN
ncbi:MAG: hypothetical protein NVS3B25_18950 [Hymenobacter sp.]